MYFVKFSQPPYEVYVIIISLFCEEGNKVREVTQLLSGRNSLTLESIPRALGKRQANERKAKATAGIGPKESTARAADISGTEVK